MRRNFAAQVCSEVCRTARGFVTSYYYGILTRHLLLCLIGPCDPPTHSRARSHLCNMAATNLTLTLTARQSEPRSVQTGLHRISDPLSQAWKRHERHPYASLSEEVFFQLVEKTCTCHANDIGEPIKSPGTYMKKHFTRTNRHYFAPSSFS